MGLKIIKCFTINKESDYKLLRPYLPFCEYFLFDTKSESHGGSGKKFDWDDLNSYVLDKPFFLSGGIGPDDTETIKKLRNNGLFGVDINSRFESKPGFKKVMLIKSFIDEIKR